jgi:hypothetical protein
MKTAIMKSRLGGDKQTGHVARHELSRIWLDHMMLLGSNPVQSCESCLNFFGQDLQDYQD